MQLILMIKSKNWLTTFKDQQSLPDNKHLPQQDIEGAMEEDTRI